MLDEIKKLIAAFRAGDWLTVVGTAGSLMKLITELLSPNPPVFAVDEAEFDACICELESCANATMDTDEVDPKKIDPATVVLIIQGVLAILKFLREWRKQ